MSDWNGTVPTILGGYVPSGDDWAAVLAELSALSGAGSTWSPTYANLTIGNGTVTTQYRRIGKWVDFYWQLTLGSTSAMSTGPTLSLPVAMNSIYNSTAALPFGGETRDFGITGRQVHCAYLTSTTVTVNFWNATPAPTTITSAAPFAWGTGDILTVWGTYQTS